MSDFDYFQLYYRVVFRYARQQRPILHRLRLQRFFLDRIGA